MATKSLPERQWARRRERVVAAQQQAGSLGRRKRLEGRLLNRQRCSNAHASTCHLAFHPLMLLLVHILCALLEYWKIYHADLQISGYSHLRSVWLHRGLLPTPCESLCWSHKNTQTICCCAPQYYTHGCFPSWWPHILQFCHFEDSCQHRPHHQSWYYLRSIFIASETIFSRLFHPYSQ